MRILLVIPPPLDRKSKRRKNGIPLKRGLLPPLGAGYIAAVLLQSGQEVSIIDSQALDYTLQEALRKVDIYKPEMLGVSFLTPQENNAYEFIRAVKRHFKNITVIVGGAHPTCFPRETMERCSDIDILVEGEGEYLMLDIIRCMQEGKTLAEVKGIYYRNDSRQVIRTPKNDRLVDLETLPLPARHLYPLAFYAPEPFENKRLPSTNIIVSRGCSYARCSFCYRSGILKREYRIQSVEKTIDEMKYLVSKFNIKEFIFYDDDLASNKKWLKEFCSSLCKEHLPVIWSFRARPNAVDYEILESAKEAGCFHVSFGFESGNQDLLDNINKGITLEQSRQAAYWANSLGLEVMGTFMLALPGETPEKAEKTVDFAIELDCAYAAFIPTHPFPGTPLYEQCLRENKVFSLPYSDDVHHARYIPGVTYVPSGYKDKKEVEEAVRKAYKRFYLRSAYFMKHIGRIKGFEDIKRYYSGFKFLLGLF